MDLKGNFLRPFFPRVGLAGSRQARACHLCLYLPLLALPRPATLPALCFRPAGLPASLPASLTSLFFSLMPSCDISK